MKRFSEYFDRYDLFLIFSIVLSTTFVYWVTSKSDNQSVHDALLRHDEYLIQGKGEKAKQLLLDVLPKGNGPLDPIWLELIRTRGSGYERFGLFMRVLKSDPGREATYEEIGNLVKIAPEAFHSQVKPLYLKDISEIDGINHEWLEKYELLLHEN